LYEAVEPWDGLWQVCDLVELLGTGRVSSLYLPVELGGAGREHEQTDAAPLALCLKGSLELGAPINLDGPDREGHALLNGV
jgi:hypothetical protein